VRICLLGPALLLAILVPGAVLANWTASGTFRYRDREFDANGFTGVEPAVSARFVDVEVVDAGSGSVIASGATTATGSFSIAVSDSVTRTVYVRALTRSTRTNTLFLTVTNGSNAVYSVASPTVPSHNPSVNVSFGTLVAEPGAGGEAFNLYDVGVYGADFMAFLQGFRPRHADELEIQWAANRGAGGSATSPGLISMRDTSGYDDTVALHEYGHYAVFAYGDSDNPAGTHALADCNQDPRLAWDEGHASAFGGAIRRHFGLPHPQIYVRTTGAPGPGNLALYFDMESETPYTCSGSTSEVSVSTVLWDMGDSAATADDTPGVDDTPLDTMARSDSELWEVMTEYLPGQTFITAEDYWDGWFNTPASNGDVAAMRQVWGDGVEIRYFPDPYEPNEDRTTAALIPVDGVARQATFFRDPDGNGSGTNAQDLDHYKFSATAGWTYVAETTSLLSACDTQLRIQNSAGTTLASNDNRAAGDLSSLITWTAPSTGTFYVQAFQASGDTTPYGSYALTLRVTPDADGDGRPDGFDNCPGAANPDQTDGDGDGRGNVCDNCPTVGNPTQTDGDADGVGNACDPCPTDPGNDTDGDGRCAAVDNCPTVANPGQQDGDADGLGDACDPCPADPGNDPDGDGHCAAADNCPAVPNPGQEDGDGDTLGDACDPCPADPGNDEDGDGVCAASDNCPAAPNPGQENADGDGLGDACDACPQDSANDADADGVCGDVDNCPALANPTQGNADGDALGDACDACPADPGNDADEDGVCGDADNCPAAANPGQEDGDGDTLGDACDPCPQDSANDADADGVCGDADNCPALFNPAQGDGDGDGIGDLCDADRDGDGVANASDCDPDTRTVSAPPGPVGSTLQFGLGGQATWSPAPRATIFALYRGSVAAGASFAYNHTCIAGGLLDPAVIDPSIPEPGVLFYYLAVGVNRCGESPLGEPPPAPGDTCPPVGSVDSDGDGVPDLDDVCAGVADPDQEDTDADGRGDACDLCPLTPDPEQLNRDGDARGDACDACPLDAGDDADADGICGDVDNCPEVPNPGQEDADQDGTGDACAP